MVSIRITEVCDVIDFLVPQSGELGRQGLAMINDVIRA
jgi:hypothetical protein